ncbi:hypothetical protein JKP88DRAFT_157043 [Tribonema minus]|uniref:Kelch repeat protein n=1 Tax=Tribonema minus TaxID=303371 RepID=A0A835Z4J3_9STRA|nr:hypothetical protein JKP88DRAFT_157043 [Tribonema minus]
MPAAGSWPSPRGCCGHCCGPGNYEFTIVGGTTVTDNAYADIWSFDVRHHVWAKLFDLPTSTYGASACWHGDNLIVFGGSTGMSYLDTVYVCDRRTGNVRLLKTHGQRPSKRYKHEAFIMENFMYIFAGGDFKPSMHNMDMHMLDLCTCTWHVATVAPEGVVPVPRCACACCVDPTTATLWVFGGFDANTDRLAAFQTYDTRKCSWSSVVTPQNPPARAFNSMVFREGVIWLLIGSNGGARFNDVWRYAVRTTPSSLQTLACNSIVKHGLPVTANVPAELHSRIAAFKNAATA